MKWSELSMTEKNEVIKMAVAQGIKDIPSIKHLYEESINGSRRFEDGGIINGGIPFKITVTGKDRRPAWKRMYQNPNLGDTSQYYNGNILESALSSTPVIGDAIDAVKAVDAVNRGNYLEAGVLGGSLLLPNAIEKPVKAVSKLVGKLVGKGIKKITKENAAKILPSEWTAAQDAAITRGDMAEAQRLRDLHFQVSAPNTVASVNGQPLQLYHGTDATFNAFDISKYGNTNGSTFGRGVYTTPVKEYAELYGKNNMPLYMKLDNPRDYRNSSIGDLIAEKLAFGDYFATGIGIDGAIGRPSWKGFKGLEEYVSHNPKNVKSSLPITYDDNGVRIPLGLRDNFKINDIRYAIAPFLIGGAAYGLSNEKADGGPIHIDPSKKGTFTAAATKHGMGVQEFASQVLSHPENYSLTMRKKANFARNSSHWKH